MTWIQTFTGKQFDIFNPKLDAIDIVDIAHSLANTCRFNGHCTHFYSVAEHSIHMLRHNYFANLHIDKIILLHDAAEAIIGDIARPHKKKMLYIDDNGLRVDAIEIERIIQDMIYYKFDCVPTDEIRERIKYLDDRMLATEKRDLMAEPPDDWEPLPEPFGTRLGYPWQPRQAEYEFIRELGMAELWKTT